MDKKDLRVVGVDVGGSSVKAGLLDEEHGLVGVVKEDSIVGDPDAMADLISGLAARHKPDIVGIGTAGAVNFDTGLVSASNLKWWGISLRRMIGERLNVPVWVDNDAQAAMMAEVHSGVLTGERCAVYITLGTGVGGALLIDGRPWRGDDNTAFELGHIITHAGGELCPCGRRGCFESYASISALSRYAGGRPPREVIDGALAGDGELVKAFDAYLFELGAGLVSVMRLFRPGVIAIGGGVSAAGDMLLNGVVRVMDEYLSVRPGEYNTRILLASHKNNAGMIGAAVLAKLHLT